MGYFFFNANKNVLGEILLLPFFISLDGPSDVFVKLSFKIIQFSVRRIAFNQIIIIMYRLIVDWLVVDLDRCFCTSDE